jgi:sec-independent protein translocase protein TatC
VRTGHVDFSVEAELSRGVTLLKQWRIAIVSIFFVAAVITPSGDPITLLALGLPLSVLYFVAILVGFLATRKRAHNSE